MKLNHLSLIALLAIMMIACGNPREKKQANEDPDYQLVWSDEFDYAGLPDSTKWSYDTHGNSWGWGNNEAQFYTSNRIENAEVKDGHLIITAIREDIEGKKFSSARLITKEKGDWLYGKFEIKAKLPKGLGMWPAIWMLPTDWEYGGWPASGEIDIMENVGFMPDSIIASAHTKSYNHMIQTQRSDSISIPTCSDEFHVYKLEWEANEFRVYVDNVHFFTFINEKTGPNEWPFDKRFHLLLNVAVGGNWGGMRGVDESIFPQSMMVDYVRVYQKKE